MDFVSPTLAIQPRQRLEKKPQATWQMCLDEVADIMEIRRPIVWRQLEAFTIEPNEVEKTEFSRFIARQKEKWTQADVESMTLEQLKMIHMVKLVPDRKL